MLIWIFSVPLKPGFLSFGFECLPWPWARWLPEWDRHQRRDLTKWTSSLALCLPLKGLVAALTLPSTALRAKKKREREGKKKRAIKISFAFRLLRPGKKRKRTRREASTVSAEYCPWPASATPPKKPAEQSIACLSSLFKWREWMLSANSPKNKKKKRNELVTTPLSRSLYHVTPRKPNIRVFLQREHGKLLEMLPPFRQY